MLETWGFAILVALQVAAGVVLLPSLLRSRWKSRWAAVAVCGIAVAALGAVMAVEVIPDQHPPIARLMIGLHLVAAVALVAGILWLVPAFKAAMRSEKNLRAIVDQQLDLICRFRPDTTLTYVNPAYAAYFQRAPEELIGTRWTHFLPESEKAGVRENLAALAGGAAHAPYEHKVVRADGVVRWHRWMNLPVFGPDGTVVEFQSVGTDITDLKESQLKAALVLEELKSVSPRVPVAIIHIKPDGTCADLNEKWAEMADVPRNELEGRPWTEPVHLDDQQRAAAAMDATLQDGAVRSGEFRIRTRAGRVTHVAASFSPVPGGDGSHAAVIATFTDISDRRRREDDSQERSERQAYAVAVSDTSTWGSVQNTREFHPDGNYPRMLGYSAGEIPDRIDDWLALIPESDLPAVKDAISSAVRGATPRFDVEHRMRCKDGGHLWVRSVGSVIPNPPDNLVRMAGTCTNITERKQAEIERDTLARLATALVDADTPRRIADTLVAGTEELFGWDSFLFSERLPGTDLFSRVLVVDKSEGKRITLDEANVQKADRGIYPELMQGTPILINRLKPDDRPLLRMGDVTRPSASLVFAPLCNREEVFGSFSVQSYTPDFFGERELRLAQAVAALAAPALRRAHLEEALRLNQRKLQALFGSSAVAAARTDLKGVVTAANDAFLEVVGRTGGRLSARR